jgi:hypothetical protein
MASPIASTRQTSNLPCVSQLQRSGGAERGLRISTTMRNRLILWSLAAALALASVPVIGTAERTDSTASSSHAAPELVQLSTPRR